MLKPIHSYLSKVNTRRHVLLAEILCIIVLLSVSCLCGLRELRDWQIRDITGHILLPGLMWASGQGFNTVIETDEIRDFTYGRVQRFDMASLSEPLLVIEKSHIQKTHLYMAGLAGALWRVFGPDWHVVKYLILSLFCISALLLYLFCRQGMGRVTGLGVVLVFVSSPVVLAHLGSLRDFSKVPFHFGAFALLAMLLNLRKSGRQYIIIAVAAGLWLGVGLGFRRDMLALALLAFPIIAACPGLELRLKHRALAVLLYLAALAVSGLPVLAFSPAEMGQDSIRILCGFSQTNEAPLNLGTTSYLKQPPAYYDTYAVSFSYVAALQGATLRNKPIDEVGGVEVPEEVYTRAYLFEMMKMFPADLVIRAFASVKAILDGVDRSRFQTVLLNSPWNYGAVALTLLLAAVASPWKATLMLYMLLVFCGYVSLQYDQRHAFHLAFVPFWFWGFVVHHLVRACRDASVKDSPFRKCPVACLSRALVRSLAWATVVIALGILCLPVLFYAQQRTLLTVHDLYVRAERTPAQTKTSPWGENTLLRVNPHAHCRDTKQVGGLLVHSATFMLHFKYPGSPMAVGVCYGGFPYSFYPAVTARNIREGDDLYLFIPILEQIDEFGYVLFNGFILGQADLDALQGVYRVNDHGLFPLVLVSTDSPEGFVASQYLSVSGMDRESQFYNAEVTIQEPEYTAIVDDEADLSDQGGGVNRHLASMARHLRDGRHDKAIEAAADIMDAFPDNPIALRRMFQVYALETDRSTLSLWEALKQCRPEHDETLRCLSALEKPPWNYTGSTGAPIQSACSWGIMP